MSVPCVSGVEVSTRSCVGCQARRPEIRRGILTLPIRANQPRRGFRTTVRASSPKTHNTWTTEESANLYSVNNWGDPYVTCDSDTGRVVVKPNGDDDGDDITKKVDLFVLASDVRERLNSNGPLVIRFLDIACRQANTLHSIFNDATKTWQYKNKYQGVFPVKCCHDLSLLTALVLDGQKNKTNFGLEAGSKAELLLAIAVMKKCSSGDRVSDSVSENVSDNNQPLLICNGYKDERYVRLAFEAAKNDIKTTLVIEKPSELKLVAKLMKEYTGGSSDASDAANSHNAKSHDTNTPSLGIRVRLGTTHSGQWGSTSGDDAKFGLGAFETLQAVNFLKKNKILEKLKLLHFHVGSQVNDIATIKEAMREASQMYAELSRLGAPMGFIDVGGGLGVDYDGTRGWGGPASVNYDFLNYANDVVAALQDVVVRTGVEPPVIVSESGRAVVSHSTVLVFEVVSTDPRGGNRGKGDEGDFDDLENTENVSSPLSLDDLRVMPPSEFLLHNFREVLEGLRDESPNIQEALNDAKQFRVEADRLFKLGIMDLPQRAEAESLFSECRELVFEIAASVNISGTSPPVDVQNLSNQPTQWYHANLSVFRSLPDVWAIHQLFPVVPIHKLNEPPTIKGAFADLTCDSDGKVDWFVSSAEKGKPQTFLPLHRPSGDSPYLIGAFLTGAYQESMGSVGHNLFGSPARVNVRRTETVEGTEKDEEHDDEQASSSQNGSFTFATQEFVVDVRAGDTNADALCDAGIDADELLDWVNSGSDDDSLTETFTDMLSGSTYLEQ